MKEKTVIKAIEKLEPDLIDLQNILTGIPALAPESGGEGELEKARALENWLVEKGLKNIEFFNSPDPRVKSGVRPNMVVTINGKNTDRNLWIISHLDVVPPGDSSLWDSDPWKAEVKHGKIYGRGTEDNQQGLVSSVGTVLGFFTAGIEPAINIRLVFAADEEVGSAHGIQYLLENTALFKNKDDLIIIPDGGDPEGRTIEVAEKNLLWLKITVKGKQSHGSRPDLGCNSRLAGSYLSLKLHDLEKIFDKTDSLFEPPYSTFEPTKIEANVPNVNTIPGEETFYMDMRILPEYSLEMVRKEVENIKAETEERYKVKIIITEEQAVESPATPKDSPVIGILSGAVKTVKNVEAYPVGIGGGTVGSYLRKKGFSPVVWSTLDDIAHQPNEYCLIENMMNDSKILALVALRG